MIKTKTVFIAEEYIFYKLVIESYIIKNDMKLVGYDKNADKIIGKIKVSLPDIIFINYSIFKKDIFDAIKQIKELSPNTNIIIVIKENSRMLLKSLMEEDIIGILQKPFSEIQLINLLNENLHN